MQNAHQHLRFGILGRQVRCPGIGRQRIIDAVEQGERAQLAPIAHFAAVELAVGRAVAVHALAQELSGLCPMPSSLHQYGLRSRLDVALEGFAGAHGRRRVDAAGEQGCRLRQTLAQLILQEGRLVAHTLGLHACRTPPAAAQQHRDCRQDDDHAARDRCQGTRPRIAQPGLHRSNQTGGTLQEPPPLHAPPPPTTPPPRRTFTLGAE